MAINFNYNSNLKLSYIETIINGSKDLESSFTGYGNISSYSSSKIVYKEGSLTLTINGSGFTSDSGDITVTSINYKITNGESFNINCSIKGNIYYSDLTDVLSNVKATKLIYTIPYGVGKFLTQTITADNLFTEYSTSDVKNFKYEISDGIGGNIIFSIPLLKASDYNNVINGNLTLKQQIEFFKSSSFLSGNDNISITKSTELFLNKNGKPELNGYAGNDTLTGSKLSDILNGGTGIDKLIGGLGNDTYYVDLTSDVVTELASQGTDTVISTASSYTLSSNVENLTLTGTSAINGTGNGSANTITGNSNNNLLNGGTGIDTLSYSNATKGVKVSLATTAQQDTIGAGKDTISNFENLTGSSYADILTGNSAANTLNGGAGIDKLIGGLGNDTYIVDNIKDVVTELASQGIDTIKSSVTYTLSTNVENLSLTGTSAINGTGNALNNVITGNSNNNVLNGGTGIDTLSYSNATKGVKVSLATTAQQDTIGAGKDTISNFENLTGSSYADTLLGNLGANILNGGTGADTLKGGLGSDIYYVDNVGDKIVETTSSSISQSGTDTVNSSITYILQDDLENLTLLGTANIDATGNYQNNILLGNSGKNILDGGKGNDILNGGAGADTMKGGNGKDTYYVDNIGDIVVEEYTTVSYTDTVNSTISYTLTDYVEDLNLIGTSAINGTGNSLNNTITGNAANNTLTGGTGSDKFVFNTKLGSTNIDKITDFNVLYDEIQLENAIFTKLATAYTLNKANFVSNDTGKAVEADDYIIYNKTDGKLFYDADGNGAGVSVLFATIENKAALTYADFTVI